jgi:orotidine-5'-phosphate decarboxylase
VAIDVLQEKIRKLKNPTIIDFGVTPEHLPQHLLDEEGTVHFAYRRFCHELMEKLKGFVPGVRFSFASFALMGPEGLQSLSALLNEAKEMGFYVILDSPGIMTPWGAERTAPYIFGESSLFPCDALIVSSYIGSELIKPFLPYCKEGTKDLFVMVRTPNKSAPELQDLMTGSRLVHMVAADMVNRNGEQILGKYGYSRVCAMTSASAPESLRNIRKNYKTLFQLVDGVDYPSGNAKNCSFAFDKMGHGAAVCASTSITAAWLDEETDSDGDDYIEQAMQAAQKLKKNLLRYISIV